MRCFLRMSLSQSLYDVLPAVRAVRDTARKPKLQPKEPKRQAKEEEPKPQGEGAEAPSKGK